MWASIFGRPRRIEEGVMVQEHNEPLFGKADFSHLSAEWTIPTQAYQQTEFHAFIIIDFVNGNFTFLKTKYMMDNKIADETIERICNFKIAEIIGFLSKFNIQPPQYCVVSQDITVNSRNKFSVIQNTPVSRYHKDSLTINVLPGETLNVIEDCLYKDIPFDVNRPEKIREALLSEYLMLRYNGSTSVSTTIKGIYPYDLDHQIINAYRFPVQKDSVVFVNNRVLDHSIPYFQESQSINRDAGNGLATQILTEPRIVERTQFKIIDEIIYTALLTNCEESMISGTYETDITQYIMPPCENIIELRDYIPELRTQIEVGGRKRKNKKSKRYKKPKKTLTNHTQKYKWYKLLKKDTL
jgi:hypothetical protein